MEPDPSVPNDPNARPSLDEVLQLRAERMAIMRDTMAALTDDVLASETDPIFAPGYPAAGTYPVSRCLKAVISEEWLHRLYAERDLAVLQARRTGTAG
jgi:DinB superfamily